MVVAVLDGEQRRRAVVVLLHQLDGPAFAVAAVGAAVVAPARTCVQIQQLIICVMSN